MPNKALPYIFILCWNRPLYLWACLDSIYRHTKYPCKIIIADNNSTDPLIKKIINSFDRRGLFYKIHLYDDNDPFRLKKLVNEYQDEIGEYFVFIEGDIEIMPLEDGCWLQKFMSYMHENNNLASVGSRVYQDDFVSMQDAQSLIPDANKIELEFLIKAKAPMRYYNKTKHKARKLIDPHNAPLRLLMIRKSAYNQIEFGKDSFIYKSFKKLGFDAMISTEVVHRHLSLLNIYDYYEYSSIERNAFFNKQS